MIISVAKLVVRAHVGTSSQQDHKKDQFKLTVLTMDELVNLLQRTFAHVLIS